MRSFINAGFNICVFYRLRDTGDELAKVLQTYSNGETVNKSLSDALANLATTFSAIEDYRNAYVQRIELKVCLVIYLFFLKSILQSSFLFIYFLVYLA